MILFGHCIFFAGTLAATSVAASLVTRLIFPELNVRGPAKSAFYYLLRKHNVLINRSRRQKYPVSGTIPINHIHTMSEKNKFITYNAWMVIRL